MKDVKSYLLGTFGTFHGLIRNPKTPLVLHWLMREGDRH
jgi:hypothetical protein